ncbi:MAG: DNA methyltransferase [Chloroflexota bacterium]
MPINREKVRKLLQSFDFRTLFIEEMGWSQVPSGRSVLMVVNGEQFLRTPIAQMSGVTVFEIIPSDAKSNVIPDRKTRTVIYKEIEGLSHENLLIFLDNGKQRTQSLWYWVKREGNKRTPREHLYLKDQPGDLFLSKLDSMVIELDELREDGTIAITKVTEKLSSSLDVERVTRKFYGEFSTLRVQFIDFIEGIDNKDDRFWYASVLLNRLMFVYFMQEKGFIQNNTRYLEDKLRASQARGVNLYYSEFLQALFFEGYAKPWRDRSAWANELLAPNGKSPNPEKDMKYLNGGLFLRHRLEQDYPNIRIPDQAFENVLDLFGRYSWHLDDTPGAKDDEINPDVLGYIFEKYINQKAFGAYYTRTEITQYLCERTIGAVIVEKVNLELGRQYDSIGDVLLHLDTELCRRLLNGILPSLSILDPACGSGAFLVAAMKTLLDVYSAVLGKIEFLSDVNLTAQLKAIHAEHPSLNYYMRKTIITNNLYGVDIMEEATEIAKLRLFLFLVSSAQNVEQLEPLPNIDFSILCGNSLIGLITVDEQRFNSTGQQDIFQGVKAAQYKELLTKKNELIRRYKDTASVTRDLVDLQALRQEIEDANATAYASLNEILLDDFRALNIKYEQAQPNGRAIKRLVVLADIQALAPFHWGYEFDEIIGTRGGFDVIITNPPWEIFKPIDREFARRHDPSIGRRDLNAKEFQAKFDQLLKDPDILQDYMKYLTSFPHVSQYFRSAAAYQHQGSGDVNLYKLFTEHCLNLLRKGGNCGIVIPSGIYSDLGTKALREMLFAGTQITGLFSFENRKTIFEGVDSRFKFVVLTFVKGGQTERFPAAFMRLDVQDLDSFPNADSVVIDIELVQRLSPDSLSITEFKGDIDIQIAEKMLRFPLLGADVSGRWKVQFANEFHMTNDNHLFHLEHRPGMLPLYEGKMIWHFNSHYSEPRYWVDEQQGRQAVVGVRGKDSGQVLEYQLYRFAYRSITGNTNERTFVCSILPCDVFYGHSLNSVKRNTDSFTNAEMLCFNAVMSSFVVDFSLRQRVGTQMTMFYVYQTAVPRLSNGDTWFDDLVERTAKLICTTPDFDDLAREAGIGSHKNGATNEVERARLRAEIDGMVAHIYGLTETEFAHILSTFPLVSEPVKVAAQNAYRDVERGLIK